MRGMKRLLLKTVLLQVTVTLLGINNIYSQVFLQEGFESASGSTPPSGWTEQLISPNTQKKWRYQEGGGASTQEPDFKSPPTAHSGTKNALFQYEGSGLASRLITPAMDLRFSTKPVLSFWLAQDVWEDNTDELVVYYRTSPTSAWIMLEEYKSTIMEWSYREIVLPSEVKVQTCQIAFVATSYYGWGVCLDDILIDERGNVTRTVNSLMLHQVNEVIPSGSAGNPVCFVEIGVVGNKDDLYLTQADFKYTGTTIADITNGSLFYTKDSVFSNETPVPLTFSIRNDTLRFSGGQRILSTGNNYIWLCLDVAASAAHNNTVDVSIQPNSFTIGGIKYPSGSQNPSGTCTIEESINYYDFESTSGWTLTNSWAIGIPQGGGYNDPTKAFAGQNVMATNLNGNYPPDVTTGSEHRATSAPFNAKYFKNVYLRYKRWLNVESTDRLRVWYSNNGGATWNQLMENTSNIFDRSWKNTVHSLTTQATRKEDIRIRFAIDQTDGTTEYGGWNIDNLALTGDFIAKDLGIIGYTSPYKHCGMTSAETVTVKIKNFGGATVNGPYEVGFSTNGGTTYTREVVNTPINSEDTLTYTFNPATANLSQPGLKNLAFKTFLTGDEDPANDLLTGSLYVFPTKNYLYSTSFESSNEHWYPSGANSTWAWGVPNAVVIDTAYQGTKAWVTKLNGNHATSEVSYLESPCFDFTAAEYPVIAFYYWVNTESGVDGFNLQYSIDDGNTWNPVPANPNHTQGWCTGTTVTSLGTQDGWTGSSGGYQLAKTLLPSDILGLNAVKFRFYFASDAANSLEGVAIDNISIYELPYDAGVLSLTSPVSGCEVGKVKLTLNVKNFGSRPLKTGMKVPLEIKHNTKPVVKDTLTIASTVTQGNTHSFTTKDKYDITALGFHTLVMNTKIDPELDRGNDTLKVTDLEVYGIVNFTLGPDRGILGWPDTIVAKPGFTTYTWSDASTNDSLIVDEGAVEEGEYWVRVTNSRGCDARDTIKIYVSNDDYGVTAISGITDDCDTDHAAPVYPEVWIKNFGPGEISVGEKVPISVMVNDEIVGSEEYDPTAAVDPGDSVQYTLTTGLNLSEVGTYNIKIFTTLNKDLVRANDSTSVSVETWGRPDVSFAWDTIVTTLADTITLDAGAGFGDYTWQDNSKNQTFPITSQLSAWYKVTVADVHACGTDADSVYINATDLGVLDIEGPITTFCENTYPAVKVRVKNLGKDDITSGSTISITYTTPNETVSNDFTLGANLEPAATALFKFPDPVNLPAGESFINVKATLSGDPNASNDMREEGFVKYTSPTVAFDRDTLFKIFGTGTYEIIPTYSADATSYLWQDNSTDSIYTVYGTPTSDYVEVIVNNLNGCLDTASMKIVTEDLSITAIKSPKNGCVLSDNTPIVITITNKGNFTYPVNTPIVVKPVLDGTALTTDTIKLLSDLASGGSTDFTLTSVANLAGKENFTIQVTVSTQRDVNKNNNSMNKIGHATGYPTVSLGPDREVHDWQEVLRPGSQFASYLWNDNSHDSTLTVTTNGTYSVTVTDYNGCSNSDEVVLQFFVDDLQLKTLNKPVSACELSSTEPVRVTLRNNGSYNINSGTQITIGFTQNETTKTDTYTLGTTLTPGDSTQIDLLKTMDFTTKKLHDVKVWAKMDGDMTPANDTISTQINAYPPASVEFGADTIKSADPIVLDPGSGYSSYLWSTSATTQTINADTDGKYWVRITNSYGCEAADTIVAVYLIPDLAITRVIAANDACLLSTMENVTARIKNVGTYSYPVGDSIVLTLNLNGSTAATETLKFTSTFNVGDSISYTFEQKLNLGSPNTYTINASLAQARDLITTNNSGSKTVHVWGNPDVNLGADKGICTGDSVLLDAGNAGCTYLWSTGSTQQTIYAKTSGNFSVTATNSHGCTDNDVVVVTVNPLPTVNLSDFSSKCINSPEFTLSGGSPSGGVYSILGETVTTFNPATRGLGTHTITYTYSNGTCSNHKSKTLTVYPLPNPTLAAFDPVCVDEASFTLTGGNPTGGTYTGPGVSGGTFNPATAGVNTHTITYTVTENGCSNAATNTITEKGLPEVSLADYSPVCVDAAPFVLTGGSPEGGVYRYSGNIVTEFNPQTAGVGTNHTITYTRTVNGCDNSASNNITVKPLPTVGLNSFSPVCVNAAPFNLSGGSPNGGEYSINGVTLSTFDPSAFGANTHTVKYTIMDNGCSNSATQPLTVKPLPSPTLADFAPVCLNDAVFTLSGGANPTGGTYSINGVTVVDFDPAVYGVGDTTVTYTVTVNGCSNSVSKKLTVKPLPSPTVSPSGSVAFCEGDVVSQLLTASPVGSAYQWYKNNSTITAGTNQTYTATSLGDYKVKVTVNGCSATSEATSIVTILPNSVTLAAFSPVCVNDQPFTLTGGSPAGGTYTINGSAVTTFNPAAFGVGDHVVTYTLTGGNGCSASDSKTLTVKAKPNPTLDGFSPVCVNASPFTLTGGSPAGGTYSVDGVTVTNFNPSLYGAGSKDVYYKYTENGCSDSVAKPITVKPLPEAVINPSGNITVCKGVAISTLLTASPEGGSYQWIKDGAPIGTATSRTYTAVALGSYTVEVTVNGCPATSAPTTISEYNMPGVSLANFSPVCINAAPFALSGGSPPGGIYMMNGSTVTTFDPASAGSGDHTIYYKYSEGGCSDSASNTISVTPLPSVSVSPTSVVYCKGYAVDTLLTASPEGSSYQWYFNGQPIPLATQRTHRATSLGRYSVEATVNGCSATSSETEISEYALPTISLSGFSPVCANAEPFALSGGSPSGGVYRVNGIDVVNFDPSLYAAGNQTIYYKYTENGCSDSASSIINIKALPGSAINPAGTITYCQGNVINTSLTASPDGSAYKWFKNNSILESETGKTLTATTEGDYAVAVTANGCADTSAVTTIVIITPENVTLEEFSPVCANDSPFTLTGGNPSGGTYTIGGTTVTTFNPAQHGVGDHTVTYTVSSAGCSYSASQTLRVNNYPTISLGEDRTITEPVVLTPGSGYTSYLWNDGSTSATLTVSQTGTYSVTVTNEHGCKGFDEVAITYQETMDVLVSQLVSPGNKCYREETSTVEVELTNRGTKTFTPGESFSVSYQIGTGTPVVETLTLSASFPKDGKQNYMFSQGANLSTGTHTFNVRTIINGQNGELSSYPVTIYENPQLDLGADTVKTNLPYTIQSGVTVPTYNWSTGAHSSSIEVNAYGKYWLDVIDSHGCAASDTIVVWEPVSVEIIPGTDIVVTLYPNPARGELNIVIESSKLDVFTIELLNPQGQTVNRLRTEPVMQFIDKINVERYTPGIYLVRVINAKGSAVFKVMVNK